MPEALPRSRLRHPAVLGLIALLLILLALVAAGAWLATTRSGLSAAADLASALSGGRLRLVPAGGRLTGPLRLREAVWEDGGLRVEAREVDLDWSPSALPVRLEIARLHAASLSIRQPPGGEPPRPPASLRLPLAVHIGQFGIGRVERGKLLVAEAVTGSFASDGANHRLAGFKARRGPVSLQGQASLEGDAPFRLAADATLASPLRERPLALALQARGPLQRFDIAGRSQGALAGVLAAVATPFAAQPIESLQASLAGFDPAAWFPQAPAALLDLEADLRPRLGKELAVGGRVTVKNRSPGRLEARRLPLVRLAGQVDWQGDMTVFSGLAASLMGDGGSLAGSGRLAGRELHLDLQAERIDAAVLHARLRPTRLRGPLTARLAPESQSLHADLADPRFRLATELERRGDRVEIRSLRLGAEDAYLQASGHLDLGAGQGFAAKGRLHRFDPSRFARLPAARIDADLAASGRLRPRLAMALDVAIHDSRFQGQPLLGQGRVDLEWPAVRRADIWLEAGPNRLEARGAFGRPGDVLAIQVAAPRLDPYGIEGDLRGSLQVTGSLAAPALAARLASRRLGRPEAARLRDLRLDASVGKAPGDPLRIDLELGTVDLPGRPGAARQVSLKAEGSRARHTLAAAARLEEDERVSLAAAGGLAGEAGPLLWRGELRELAVTAREPARRLRLLAPAPLRLGAGEWALGPARLAGDEWEGTLLAAAGHGRLQVEATGSGRRLGQVEGSLAARLASPWQLDRQAPWQGRLRLAVSDLSWLGELLGDERQAAGRLHGELHLAGTPARPLASGDIRGEGLGLRLLDLGVQLENGRLEASLDGDRVRIASLGFDSRLRPPPRPLAVAAGAAAAELARLAAAPGRLEGSGAILLAPAAGADEAALAFRLARVGVIQENDRWVVLSGQGEVRWREGALGLEADVKADAGYWELARPDAPRLSDDVVVRRPPSQAGAPAEERKLKLSLDIEADLGPRFHFRGAGLESRLAGSLRVTAQGKGLPRAFGSIRTVRGQFDAYGQKLAVERGIINFQGLLENPTVNARAMRQGLPVDVGVEVTGPVKRPVVRLVSDPAMPEAEKLSWLVLGHGSDQAGAGDASVLFGAANALFGRSASGGGIVRQLQERFGLTELGLRQGQLDQAGGRQPTSRVAGGSGFSSGGTGAGERIVTVGKRLSSNVVLSYERALGSTESIIKLTVNLSRRLSLVGRAGADNAIDLFYTFTFGR